MALKATQISAGGYHSLALLEDGNVIGWGEKTNRQITIPDFGGRRATQISSGIVHSLALLEDGNIIGWGNNDEYQTTIPDFGGRRVILISAGGFYSLALLENGTVVGWGLNNYGQITNFLPPPPPPQPLQLPFQPPPPPPPPPQPLQLPFQPLPDFKIQDDLTLANYQTIKERVECPHCHINLKKVILNCNHTVCETCSNALTNCPTCAEIIISKIVFHKKYYKY
jgi:hypothetical protein